MGLAASQGRLLLLTARDLDLQARAQELTNTDQILAMQTEQVAKQYSNKLSNKKLMLISSVNVLDNAKTQDVDVSYNALITNKYIVQYAKDGAAVNPNISNAELQNLIKRGVIVIYNDDANGANGEPVNIAGSTEFYDTYDTSDDGAATAEYESKMAEINTKEKQLQIDLKQVESEQKAVDTEIDSVKKIIDKNIERTFKVFA